MVFEDRMLLWTSNLLLIKNGGTFALHMSEFVIGETSTFTDLYTYFYGFLVQFSPVLDLLYSGLLVFAGVASDYALTEASYWKLVGTHVASAGGTYFFRDFAILALDAHKEGKQYQTIDEKYGNSNQHEQDPWFHWEITFNTGQA